MTRTVDFFQYREDALPCKNTWCHLKIHMYDEWTIHCLYIQNIPVILRQNPNWHCHWFSFNNKAACFIWHSIWSQWWWVKVLCQVQQHKLCIVSVTRQSNWKQCSVYHASVSENFLCLMSLWKLLELFS